MVVRDLRALTDAGTWNDPTRRSAITFTYELSNSGLWKQVESPSRSSVGSSEPGNGLPFKSRLLYESRRE